MKPQFIHFDLRGPGGNALSLVATAKNELRRRGHDAAAEQWLADMPFAAASYQEVLDAVENAFDEADRSYRVWFHREDD